MKLLLERSEGLFLYVCFLDALLTGLKEDGKELSLESLNVALPDSLDGFCSVFFQRIYEALGSDQQRYERVLGPIARARKPVSLENWVEMCGYKNFSNRAFKCDVDSKTKELVHHVDGTVCLIHKSMSDFLVGMNRAGLDLYIESASVHNELAHGAKGEKILQKNSP